MIHTKRFPGRVEGATWLFILLIIKQDSREKQKGC
jgi:hypothetical protein